MNNFIHIITRKIAKMVYIFKQGTGSWKTNFPTRLFIGHYIKKRR